MQIQTQNYWSMRIPIQDPDPDPVQMTKNLQIFTADKIYFFW